MNSNTCSPDPTIGSQDDLATLAAAVDGLAARDLTGLADGVRAERVLVLRRLVDRLEGQWLDELAGVDARGAAGAEHGTPAPSTASWLRGRLHLGASAATSAVRTARALFAGPLTTTAQALCAGELSAAHAAVLAHGTHDLPDHTTAEAEPVLVAAARRHDPPRLRRVIGHRHLVADPDGASSQAERRHGRRGLWLAPTWEGMVALHGLLEPEAGQVLLAALAPWPAPTTPMTLAAATSAAPTPDRAGPPPPGGRSAAPDRRGPPPADRRRRPRQPPRPPGGHRRGGWLGGAAGTRGLPPAGL